MGFAGKLVPGRRDHRRAADPAPPDERERLAEELERVRGEAARAEDELRQAHEALYQADAERARHVVQQATVARLGLRALAASDPDAVPGEILDTVLELLDADAVVEHEWAPAGQMIRPRLVAGRLNVPLDARSVGEGDIAYGLAPGHRLLVGDWWSYEEVRQSLREPGARATLAVPISEGEGVTGLLAVHSVRPREFRKDEAETLQALANLLAGTRERKRNAEEMLWRALHDPLTELPNRVLFVDRLRHATAHASRTNTSVAVMFLDLDHFKFVNDSLGHTAGDELLRQIAERLREAMRDHDTVARFGGDEFLLICEGLGSAEEAKRIAQRTIDLLGRPMLLAGQRHVVTISLGIAIAAGPDRDPEDLIREADAAMYEAKEQGRNGFALYDEAMRARAIRRLKIEHQLRRAIENGELRLSYQPVFTLPERRMSGVEALVRWNSPKLGMTMPDEFMQVAEQSGLIVPMGRWVLREAVRQAAEWQQRHPELRLPVAVNLSAREITRRDLHATVAALLTEHGLDPRLLELEITESVLMDPAETSMESLHALRELGVRIILDDFGTGYSSLSYVKHFPIDGLKIDRSFVQEMVAASADASIVEAVVSMARGLGLGVTAEGVETGEQADLLEDLGCVRCQGFAFSPAVEPEEIERLLQAELGARALDPRA